MKALIPDLQQTIIESNQAAVYRDQLLWMMAMQDTKGISTRIGAHVLERYLELAEEYRLNRGCDCGDEKLFIDAESRQLPINPAIKERMLRIERNTWAKGVNGKR